MADHVELGGNMRSGHLELDQRQPKVLLVDDDELTLQTLAMLCEALGVDSVATVGGISALEELERDQVSLVITDVRMPQMNGLRLLHTIKESRPQLPVVLTSAFELSHYEQIIADHYANGVLAKPLKLQELKALFDEFGLCQ